jgi:hypothetical protein
MKRVDRKGPLRVESGPWLIAKKRTPCVPLILKSLGGCSVPDWKGLSRTALRAAAERPVEDRSLRDLSSPAIVSP